MSRQRDPADRRRHVVALSPAGATHLAAVARANAPPRTNCLRPRHRPAGTAPPLLLALQASHRPARAPASDRPLGAASRRPRLRARTYCDLHWGAPIAMPTRAKGCQATCGLRVTAWCVPTCVGRGNEPGAVVLQARLLVGPGTGPRGAGA